MSRTVLAHTPVDDSILANLGTAARMVHLPMHQAVLLAHDEHIAVDFIASVIAGDHQTFLAGVDWDHLRNTMQAQMARTHS